MSKINEYSRYYHRGAFDNLCISTVLDVLEKLGTTRSLSIAIAVRNSAITKELLDTDPLHYFDAYSYQLDAQAIAIVKKCNFIDLGIDSETIEKATLQSWLMIESELKEVNLEIRSRKNFLTTSTLENASRILTNLLPSVTSIKARNTPIPQGATARLSGLNVNIVNKLEVLDITSSAFRHYKNYYGVSTFSRGLTTLMTSLGSTFEVVPKDQFKRRTIAKEPMGNMMLQLDAAKTLRCALGRIGINLETQQDFHGFLVREFYEEFATIDLSDASDRISVELVRALLPTEWFDYLNDIRSKFTFLPGSGKRVLLEKFSPQGNGFTFELETLLFYALCRTVVPERELVSVYGDDMIVPAHYAERVQEVLVRCGLKVNFKKSYHSGPFRESCGVDTFNGIDVRPTYFKDLTRGLFGYYELANRVYEIEIKTGISMSRPLHRILGKIEKHHRCYGPDHLGDSVLHTRLLCDSNPGVTRNYITYYRILQRKFMKYKTGYFNQSGKFIKKRSKHLYVITCDDLENPNSQLSYALMHYPEEGVTQRNAPFREEFISVCYS